MKYPLRLWIAISLICCTVPFTRSNAASTKNGQGAPASSSKTQGLVQPPTAKERFGGVDVLSDTGGVDLSPYLYSVLKIVKQNWYAIVPERGPRVLRGEVSIEFAM